MAQIQAQAKRLITEEGAEFDRVHWEAVVRTLIERIGVVEVRALIDEILEEKELPWRERRLA